MAAIKGLGRNIPYLRQQFAALLGNTSTSVKFICIVVLFSYCLSFSAEAVRLLSVTPGYLLPSSLLDLDGVHVLFPRDTLLGSMRGRRDRRALRQIDRAPLGRHGNDDFLRCR